MIQTILNIDSDQDLFCKLSRPTIQALLFASVATLLAITVDRYLSIVKPQKYRLVVTKRRVFVAVAIIWLTACCVFTVVLVHTRKSDERLKSLCHLDITLIYFKQAIIVYFPLTLITILNVRILIVAEKKRRRVLAETATNTSDVNRFFHALKAAKTFSIVVAVLTFCVLTPTVVGLVLKEKSICSASCRQLWFVVFHFEFYGTNSIVNAFIYGMRHIKYREASGHILLRILRCNKLTNQ